MVGLAEGIQLIHYNYLESGYVPTGSVQQELWLLSPLSDPLRVSTGYYDLPEPLTLSRENICKLVCVCVCMRMHRYTHMCARAYRGQDLSFFLSWHSLSLINSFTDSLDSGASNPLGWSSLPLRAVSTDMCPHAWLFTWCWGSNCRSSCYIYSKPLTSGAISPGSHVSLILTVNHTMLGILLALWNLPC